MGNHIVGIWRGQASAEDVSSFKWIQTLKPCTAAESTTTRQWWSKNDCSIIISYRTAWYITTILTYIFIRLIADHYLYIRVTIPKVVFWWLVRKFPQDAICDCLNTLNSSKRFEISPVVLFNF